MSCVLCVIRYVLYVICGVLCDVCGVLCGVWYVMCVANCVLCVVRCVSNLEISDVLPIIAPRVHAGSVQYTRTLLLVVFIHICNVN